MNNNDKELGRIVSLEELKELVKGVDDRFILELNEGIGEYTLPNCGTKDASIEGFSIYHPKFDLVYLSLSRGITPDILEFLQKYKFICSFYAYDIGLLKQQRIDVSKLDILDMYLVYKYYNKDFSGYRVSTVYKKSNKEIYEIYISSKSFIDSEEFDKLRTIQEMLIRANYFDTNLNVDIETFNNRLDELNKEKDQISLRFKNEYNVDLHKVFQVKDFLSKELDEEVTSISFQNLNKLYDKYNKFYILDIIRYKKVARACAIQVDLVHSSNRFGGDCRIIDTGGINQLKLIGYDVIKAKKGSYYFISIRHKWGEYRLYEHKKGFSVGNVDYNVLVASRVYDKNIEDVTKEEMIKAKIYNLWRLIISLNSRRYSNIIEKLGEDYDKFLRYDSEPYEIGMKVRLGYNKHILDSFHRFNEEVINLRDVSSNLSENDFMFYDVINDTYIFRVSNKINPFRVFKILDKTFNFDYHDIFNMFSIGYSYKDILDNPKIDIVSGRQVIKGITHDIIDKGFREIEKEKLDDPVARVLDYLD